jgi:hypothetical protein
MQVKPFGGGDIPKMLGPRLLHLKTSQSQLLSTEALTLWAFELYPTLKKSPYLQRQQALMRIIWICFVLNM